MLVWLLILEERVARLEQLLETKRGIEPNHLRRKMVVDPHEAQRGSSKHVRVVLAPRRGGRKKGKRNKHETQAPRTRFVHTRGRNRARCINKAGVPANRTRAPGKPGRCKREPVRGKTSALCCSACQEVLCDPRDGLTMKAWYDRFLGASQYAGPASYVAVSKKKIARFIGFACTPNLQSGTYDRGAAQVGARGRWMSFAGAPRARKGSMCISFWKTHPVALHPQTRAAALRSRRSWLRFAGKI